MMRSEERRFFTFLYHLLFIKTRHPGQVISSYHRQPHMSSPMMSSDGFNQTCIDDPTNDTACHTIPQGNRPRSRRPRCHCQKALRPIAHGTEGGIGLASFRFHAGCSHTIHMASVQSVASERRRLFLPPAPVVDRLIRGCAMPSWPSIYLLY